MFGGCSSLEILPDISKLDTSNVRNMMGVFLDCKSLKALPDISNWNTLNINYFGGIISDPSLSFLQYIPDTEDTYIIEGTFSECSSLEVLPDISKWNTTDVINMSGMFYDCESLKFLPDISKWNTNKLTNL